MYFSIMGKRSDEWEKGAEVGEVERTGGGGGEREKGRKKGRI